MASQIGDDVHAGLPALGDVLVERARIPREVLVRAELHRVHEDRDHDEVRASPRLRDESEVAFVQRAHRGDHGDDEPLAARDVTRGAQRLLLVDELGHQASGP